MMGRNELGWETKKLLRDACGDMWHYLKLGGETSRMEEGRGLTLEERRRVWKYSVVHGRMRTSKECDVKI